MVVEKIQQIYDSYLHNARKQEDQNVSPFDMVKNVMYAKIQDIESALEETLNEGDTPIGLMDEDLRDLNVARAAYSELQGKPKERDMYLGIAHRLQDIIDAV